MSRFVVLPSGARVRGRRLSEDPESPADFLLALADGPLPTWPHRRIRWPDFWIPTRPAPRLSRERPCAPALSCQTVPVSRFVVLPSGARVRGRRLSEDPESPADFLLALADGPLPTWPHRRIRWPDFWIPTDRADALGALAEALRRVHAGEVVEVACHGGRGRTGTALAALAVLDGMPPGEAVAWVRREYDRGAVETPWQRWWVRRIRPPAQIGD